MMNKFSKKEPFVILLVGAPLSGKTTWCYNNVYGASIISRDDILLEMYGDSDYSFAYKNADHKLVDSIFEERIINCVKNRDNVIIDMTNLSSRRRKYNLSFFDSSYYKVSVTFPILKDEEYIDRNNKRKKENNKDISLGVIKSMLKKYTPPNKEEGFDLCIYV